jgi:hypothetical protein
VVAGAGCVAANPVRYGEYSQRCSASFKLTASLRSPPRGPTVGGTAQSEGAK